MNRTAMTTGLAILAASFTTLSPLPAQLPTLPREAAAALEYFLEVDCELAGQDRSLDRLLVFRGHIEPHLVPLLRHGPSETNLRDFDRVAEEDWARREAFLRRNPEFTERNRIALTSRLNREQYLRERRSQIIQKYREKAAIALAAIGSREALRALEEVPGQDNESLHLVIRAALEQFRRR